ncbi:Imm1 family immunity protein [Actinoalloteichus caeruleus]|uniref:Immunity protein Imm1 n=1 Tax=Actinoalloteichus caeruleus DSM 43889 TaxID=1120930 RepID=A0ABT1JB75_ACTCY|nr:Imm1 family immunity protein [Actinoalloteichus caeruleus]MCP2329750.1 Immunity protein Imm1 [Actinoalloteichus caeruleus DSM 43889]
MAVVVTAIIDNVRHYARTEGERTALVRAVVDEPHPAGPSLLYVWDRPAGQGAGHEAWPEWQLRVSTVPDQGVGALNWAGDSPDGDLGPWDTYNPGADLGGSALLFDESAPLFFPLSATLALQDVRRAVTEHLRTGRRPECVQWQPGDWY